jgi:nucleoid DNA-binding protein
VKQISFNRNLNHNDGLLTGRISGTSGISYGDARNLVEEYVSEIKRKLEKGEKVTFDNIGSFINNQEGNIQFEPDRNVNYHLDSYGLEPFQCLPLEGYDVRKRMLRHIGKDPVKQTSIRKILWRAAVIIPLLGIMIAVPLKTDFFKAKFEATTLNPLVNVEFENNKKAVDEEIKTELPKIIDNPAQVPEVTSFTESKLPASEEVSMYSLITGSFKSEENAASQVDILKAQGFTPEIVAAPNGFYRVSAMTCSDMNIARTKRDSIIEKFPGAWISRKL